MTEEFITRPRVLGKDRALVTPIDELRAGDFGVGTINSGGVVSGGGLTLRAVSSPSRLRVLNADVYNNDGGWLEVEFRDGGFAGGRVLGPFKVLSRDQFSVPQDQLKGRYFTSSIYAMILSGWVAQPLSNGVKVNVSFIAEPLDFYHD